MSRVIIVAVIIAVMAGVCNAERYYTPEECGLTKRDCHYIPYKEWDELSAHCEIKCGDEPDKPCVRMFQSGCVCKPGLLKTEDGDCVKPRDCPYKVNNFFPYHLKSENMTES